MSSACASLDPITVHALAAALRTRMQSVCMPLALYLAHAPARLLPAMAWRCVGTPA
ncbi:wbscr20c protein [Xanthomonas oryzae pv. oryzicola BLS256]|uniref:Wbscr20c protein n=1 Tax=Xanthomonas oryzae pv. oryzicola (strain BLS256) TaxID=383407 RepID=G7THJ2_XANOB|nr:wbscr20c protein [Xanthomonas oryzae pv. oryzicola BLS256]QEO97206.1 hypothetical protein XOCgx_2214 [Xanthomonas oryzae pv. oryzicola]